jgi:hypothetical protein
LTRRLDAVAPVPGGLDAMARRLGNRRQRAPGDAACRLFVELKERFGKNVLYFTTLHD